MNASVQTVSHPQALRSAQYSLQRTPQLLMAARRADFFSTTAPEKRYQGAPQYLVGVKPPLRAVWVRGYNAAERCAQHHKKNTQHHTQYTSQMQLKHTLHHVLSSYQVLQSHSILVTHLPSSSSPRLVRARCLGMSCPHCQRFSSSSSARPLMPSLLPILCLRLLLSIKPKRYSLQQTMRQTCRIPSS